MLLRGAHSAAPAPSAPASATSSPPGRSLVGLAMLVAAAAMLGIPAHATYGARVTADEPQYLLSAISLGDDGDLDIADELAAEAYRPFHRVDLPRQSTPLADGRELSPHDPLLPLLLAVPVRVGGWPAAKATLALMAGTLAALTAWVAVARVGVPRRLAWWVVACFGCSAPLATYGTQIYPEVPAALAAMVALAVLTGPLDRRAIAVLVVSVTAMAWLSVKYAPVGATLVAVGLWQLRARRRDATALVVACALSALMHVALHRAIYGGFTPYAVGDHFATSGELSVVGSSPNYAGRARRLTGLLVDDAFGIGAWAPAWLVLPYAVGVWVRSRPRVAGAVLLPFAAGWVVASFVALTMHGWWWPGRQVVVVLPFAVLLIARALADAPRLRPWFALASVAGVATWAWTTVEAIVRSRVLVVDFDRTANPWYRAWQTLLPDGRRGAAADDLLLLGWTFLLVATACLGARRRKVRSALPFPPDSL